MKHVRFDQLGDESVSHDPTILKRVFLRNGEVPRLTQVARATFEAGQLAPRHRHDDMWEIFLCDSGTGEMTVDGHTIALAAGSCVLVEPGEQHEVRNPGSDPLVLTVFGIVE